MKVNEASVSVGPAFLLPFHHILMCTSLLDQLNLYSFISLGE